jgi:inosine-uridine nucleoside N-ribohydrolase
LPRWQYVCGRPCLGFLILLLLGLGACPGQKADERKLPAAMTAGPYSAQTSPLVSRISATVQKNDLSPLLLDTDMGLDDARVVLSLPMQSCYQLSGVVTVAGAASASSGAVNALKLLAALGIDTVAVASGSETRLDGSTIPAPAWRTMAESLGGLQLPPANRAPEAVSGNEFIRTLLNNTTRPVTILAIGPVTNIARIIKESPELIPTIRAVYVLGDFNQCQEYNCATDPEAAQILVNSNVPLVMLPEAALRRLAFNRVFLQRVEMLSGPVGTMIATMMAQHSNQYSKLWDDTVLVASIVPQLFTFTAINTHTQTITELQAEPIKKQLLTWWNLPRPLMFTPPLNGNAGTAP